MSEKVPCKECGTLILPTTAARNNGLCMPCKTGNRKAIEEAKEYYKKERELDATCPFRALWRELVDKVHKEETGFKELSENEKQYFSVGLLDGEIYNGGFIQYFDNSSADYYLHTEMGLIRIGAKNSLRLLRNAKSILFGENPVPSTQQARWSYTASDATDQLDGLDSEYCEGSEDVGQLLEEFARETGLVKNA